MMPRPSALPDPSFHYNKLFTGITSLNANNHLVKSVASTYTFSIDSEA